MSRDFNHPNYPSYESNVSDSEKHKEEDLNGFMTNSDDEHPLFSSKGILRTINESRNLANSFHEKELTGEIKDKVIEDIILASRKTKFPADFLIHLCDWENDITKRSDASDAESIAKKCLNSISELKITLGRDPFGAEIFAHYILGSASKVKEIIDNAEKKPKDEVKPLGAKKDNILLFKGRNSKEKKRTNYELYQFFKKRINIGQNSFNTYVMDKPYES